MYYFIYVKYLKTTFLNLAEAVKKFITQIMTYPRTHVTV